MSSSGSERDSSSSSSSSSSCSSTVEELGKRMAEVELERDAAKAPRSADKDEDEDEDRWENVWRNFYTYHCYFTHGLEGRLRACEAVGDYEAAFAALRESVRVGGELGHAVNRNGPVARAHRRYQSLAMFGGYSSSDESADGGCDVSMGKVAASMAALAVEGPPPLAMEPGLRAAVEAECGWPGAAAFIGCVERGDLRSVASMLARFDVDNEDGRPARERYGDVWVAVALYFGSKVQQRGAEKRWLLECRDAAGLRARWSMVRLPSENENKYWTDEDSCAMALIAFAVYVMVPEERVYFFEEAEEDDEEEAAEEEEAAVPACAADADTDSDSDTDTDSDSDTDTDSDSDSSSSSSSSGSGSGTASNAISSDSDSSSSSSDDEEGL